VRFTNGYQYQAVNLFWVDTRCVERPHGTLLPGGLREQDTYVGHVWRMRAGDGLLLREYRVPASAEVLGVGVP
jgi:hypothetical protein